MTHPKEGYTIRVAMPADLRTVSDLLRESARWMHDRGWDAWPVDGFPDARLLLDINDRTCWLVEHAKKPVATFILDSRPDPDFIAAGLGQEGVPVTEALLIHKMAVRRDLKGRGIGSLILDWAADRAAAQERRWLWANVARRAIPLQAWYISNGFLHMTTVTLPDRPSGSLWRRPARSHPYVRDIIRKPVRQP